MNKGIFFIGKEADINQDVFQFETKELRNHISIIGTTGKGLTTNFENVKVIKQSQEEINERNKQLTLERHQQNIKKEKLNDAIKRAYLDNMVSQYELDTIEFLLGELFNKEISFEMTKKLFMSLPQRIIGHGIQWGFDDTEVRSDIYCYFEENKDSILNLFNNVES